MVGSMCRYWNFGQNVGDVPVCKFYLIWGFRVGMWNIGQYGDSMSQCAGIWASIGCQINLLLKQKLWCGSILLSLTSEKVFARLKRASWSVSFKSIALPKAVTAPWKSLDSYKIAPRLMRNRGSSAIWIALRKCKESQSISESDRRATTILTKRSLLSGTASLAVQWS